MQKEWITYIPQKNGTVLASLPGYFESDDFYAMYAVIEELLQPESHSYGVDSMGVDGYFRKDGILVRMCSDSAYDTCCLVYDPRSLSEEEQARVKGWLEQVVEELHRRLPRG